MGNEFFKWSLKDKQLRNTLRIIKGKDVFLLIINQMKYCFKFVCEWDLFRRILGTTRVRKGMPASLPSRLLKPTIPCCILYWTFIGIYVLRGLNLKGSMIKTRWGWEWYCLKIMEIIKRNPRRWIRMTLASHSIYKICLIL